MNIEKLADYSIKKYGRTYKALGGHWFWKRWFDFKIWLGNKLRGTTPHEKRCKKNENARR